MSLERVDKLSSIFLRFDCEAMTTTGGAGVVRLIPLREEAVDVLRVPLREMEGGSGAISLGG